MPRLGLFSNSYPSGSVKVTSVTVYKNLFDTSGILSKIFHVLCRNYSYISRTFCMLFAMIGEESGTRCLE